MRRRLILSTLAVVLVVVAVFGISLILVESRSIENSARDSVKSEAVQLVSVVESRIVADEQVSPATMNNAVPHNRHVRIEVPGKKTITLGKRPEGKVIEASQSGAHGERITVRQGYSSVQDELGRTLLIILAVALLAVAAAAILAVRQAHRVAAPLTDLAETAERLGSGDPRPRHRRYGVPELTASPTCWTAAPTASAGC